MNHYLKMISQAAIEKDPKKRSMISLELSELITKPGGLLELFSAVIDFDLSSQKVTTHNQRFMAIADMISRLPTLCLPFKDYAENITKQLKPLLHGDNFLHSNLAAMIIKSMLESPKAKNCDIRKIVFDPIFAGLEIPNTFYKPHESILAIRSCLQSHVPTKNFIDIFPNLFAALNALGESPSSLKAPLKEILVNVLNSMAAGAACCLIQRTLFHSDRALKLYSIQANDDGISLVIKDVIEQEDVTDDDDCESSVSAIVNTMMQLLEQSKNDLLVLDFFFHFQETMWSSQKEKWQHLSAALIEPLLEEIFKDKPKLDVLSVVATNGDKALDLILRTLLNYTTFLREAGDDFDNRQNFVVKSISSCLNIIDVIMIALHTAEREKVLRTKCLPILRDIDRIHKLKSSSSRSQEQASEFSKNLSSLIDRLEGCVGDKIKPSTSHEDDNDGAATEYSSIIKELNDELVPVRVHALVRLKQLVMANDKYTLDRVMELCDKIESTLDDEEPYVFLASINLMAEMALRRTKDILPKLLDLYAKQELNVQHRINVGEIMVRLSRQLNTTAPYYAQQVMSVLFVGCRDEDELMRMSSLANIGEMCKNLGSSLEKYIVEMMVCIKSILASDTMQVKGAALDLLRNTLMGLESSVDIEPIQKELKDIYALLKAVKSRTLDETLCVQAELALDEVRRLARQMLALDADRPASSRGTDGSISRDLVKNIKVLTLDER